MSTSWWPEVVKSIRWKSISKTSGNCKFLQIAYFSPLQLARGWISIPNEIRSVPNFRPRGHFDTERISRHGPKWNKNRPGKLNSMKSIGKHSGISSRETKSVGPPFDGKPLGKLANFRLEAPWSISSPGVEISGIGISSTEISMTYELVFCRRRKKHHRRKKTPLPFWASGAWAGLARQRHNRISSNWSPKGSRQE